MNFGSRCSVQGYLKKSSGFHAGRIQDVRDTNSHIRAMCVSRFKGRGEGDLISRKRAGRCSIDILRSVAGG